jgi:hypothetical protein
MVHFNLGIFGAGIATSLSSIIVVFIIAFRIRKNQMLYFNWGELKFKLEEAKKICKIGSGSFISQLLNAITIILMNRGPVYTSTKGYGDISAIKNWRIFDVTNDSEKSAYRIFAKALDLTLMKLEESNKKIIYIHNEPELGFDIRTCITSHPIRFGNSLGYRNPCALEKSKFLKRNLEHRMMVDSILVKHPTVKSIDLSEALCENNYCYGKNNDYLFYRDDNHLSVNGAKYVCDKLRSKFD